MPIIRGSIFRSVGMVCGPESSGSNVDCVVDCILIVWVNSLYLNVHYWGNLEVALLQRVFVVGLRILTCTS
jgi:hypothetical protein